MTTPRATDLNYPETGASTTPGRPLPAGYNHLRHRAPIGHGRAALEAAGAAVLDWRMHRAAGVRITTDADRAAPGAAVHCAIGIGPLRAAAPCRVIWTADGPDRYGFAYGTRRGHLAVGEETFLVEMGPDKAVWFTVNAFSRPRSWYARLAGPLLPLAQRLFAHLCARALTRIATAATAGAAAGR
ncbi:DUF1990 domain-containing protein [Streptomyces sp. CB01881]|uniref:DUF1990 family protein n=1 Tax=Streptomyces sp. CB01881 TaxID=2078691 RepID=UPI000CDC1362|nr:DUF1990 domain-containing protein [Streptomyces sp. CB01881]AUY52459.1 DUF1990 domain-containing protein [Streptomyces sp. CB01881]TYC71885.1 DUF1990 domain-containing protein [Streptomyces sp. CB01881]